jgi:hypothetical protein
VFLTAAQAFALIVLATPLTLQWGVMGTILGVGITMALAFGLSCYYIFRQVPLSIGATFGVPLVAASMAIVALLTSSRLPGWDRLLPMVRLLAVGAAGPGVFMLALFVLRPSEMTERLRYVLRLFGARRTTI